MKNDVKKCIHGDYLWINGKDHSKRSTEYKKGCFHKVCCNITGEICSFDDYKNCTLWEKKNKE